MPVRRPKETLLQVKERTAREIRNRTEARVRALLHKDSESEESTSDEEDLIVVPFLPLLLLRSKITICLLIGCLASL